MTTNGTSSINSLTNYAAYLDPTTKRSRIGHLDFEASTITPLAFQSGTALTNLYEVIAAGEANIAPCSPESIPLSTIKLLPPISGRDVLAVGKNYAEHAREFNSSGYDASDKVDQPTHPVIFTKRATSIIASGEPILLHPEFTSSVDYEGEIGVIIGKSGFQITEKEAMDYVWGYTIVNDMTARERQRDHKQFFLGKSPDTFCPMGPVAVPKGSLPEDLKVQTFVNGEKRQEGTIKDLIFSIPKLIATISTAQTLQAGDLIATGTPAGVGFGFRPMKFLKAGEEVCISVTGLGTLKNKIAASDAKNTTVDSLERYVPISNQKAPAGSGLTNINGKDLFSQHLGKEDGPPIIFIHGLGGSSTYFYPVISKLKSTHSLHLLDLEGHGLSPTSALSNLTIRSFADDFYNMAQASSVKAGATVIAHSMGCLVAMKLALLHPGLVSKLILMGPPPSPLPEAASKGTFGRAALVREKGMLGVVDAIVQAGTSALVQAKKPLSIVAARMSLLGQDPEGYAKACMALARSVNDKLEVQQLKCPVFILTGDEDKVSPPELCHKYAADIADAKVHVLKDVGHWHLFEEVEGCVDLVLANV